jgi:hypothetical protein
MSDTFQQFMQKVDRELVSRCGLTHRDLADFAFYDAYSDECDPAEVAVEILQENDFPFPQKGKST